MAVAAHILSLLMVVEATARRRPHRSREAKGSLEGCLESMEIMVLGLGMVDLGTADLRLNLRWCMSSNSLLGSKEVSEWAEWL